MKTWLLFLFKLALTAGCLWWALSGVDIHATVLSRPWELDPGWLLLGMAFAGLAVVLGALRWQIFLAAQKIHLPLLRVLELTLIGGLFTLLSVGSLGSDAARIVLLSRQEPRRKLALTVSVLMDHMSGMVAMALLFLGLTAGRFGALEAESGLGHGVLQFAWVCLGGGLVLMVVLFVLMSPWGHRIVHRDGRWLHWECMRTIPEAWDVYRRKWPHVLAGIAVAVALLFAYYLTFWAGLRAVGWQLDPGSVCAAMPVIDAISSIPVSVAGIGVREKLFTILLGDLAGVDGAVAVSASLVGFMLHAFWAAVGGVVFLRHRGEVGAAEAGASQA